MRGEARYLYEGVHMLIYTLLNVTILNKSFNRGNAQTCHEMASSDCIRHLILASQLQWGRKKQTTTTGMGKEHLQEAFCEIYCYFSQD